MSPSDPPPPDEQPGGGSQQPKPKSFGNISPAHWSRARSDMNTEALDYYRERSHAPGVAEGGAERNFYCMECDGVIPFDPSAPADRQATRCPHCGAGLDEGARRFFNWVELDTPPRSDLRALLPIFGAVALGTALVVLLAVWLLS